MIFCKSWLFLEGGLSVLCTTLWACFAFYVFWLQYFLATCILLGCVSSLNWQLVTFSSSWTWVYSTGAPGGSLNGLVNQVWEVIPATYSISCPFFLNINLSWVYPSFLLLCSIELSVLHSLTALFLQLTRFCPFWDVKFQGSPYPLKHICRVFMTCGISWGIVWWFLFPILLPWPTICIGNGTRLTHQ